MRTFAKVIHLLALGLWFGSIVFFSFFTALPIIRGMEQLAESRPAWVPGLQQKQQGTRLAGEALAPVFQRYFHVQIGCALIAAIAILIRFQLWRKDVDSTKEGVFIYFSRRVMVIGLLLAIGNAVWLAPNVNRLRHERYSPDPVVAQKANVDFGRWHAYSLAADMATLLCVTVAFVLAVGPVARNETQPSGQSPEKTSTAGPVM